jgi:hypothetical protein
MRGNAGSHCPGHSIAHTLFQGDDVEAADQQILTAAVMREVGLSVPVLWVHYLSIGGSEMANPVAAYLDGFGVLPTEERDLISQALNELIMDVPWMPQAPHSGTPLVTEYGP